MHKSLLETFGKISRRDLHTTRFLLETHYQVLKLPRNCSGKEIKESFIKLSKEYHPDSKTSKSSNKNFVKLVEAYNVLGKPDTRRLYDLGLPTAGSQGKQTAPEQQRNPWDDPTLYKNRDKSQDEFYEEQPYYGFKGVKKVSNGVVLSICLFLMVSGIVLQMAAIRHSSTLKRELLIKKSNENEAILLEIRRKASIGGNDYQIEQLKQRMRDSKYTNYTEDDGDDKDQA